MSDPASSTQLAERPAQVRDYLDTPAIRSRFESALGAAKAPRFMSALITLSTQSNLRNCEPKSIIASALVAATLDLPIEKQLGFSFIVPYGSGEKKVAQFQMAAKGYVQLALRSGQYHRLNAKPVNAEAFGGFDEVGEPKIDWNQLDETKEIVGYVVAWKLVNGFTKVAYWTKAKVEAHAKKFSKAYAAEKQDSPWFTNFDKMALKTVVMNELRSWGVLSVDMQTAIKHDMGVQKDIDDEVDFIDNDTEDFGNTAEGAPVTGRPPAPARNKAAPKGVSAASPAKTVEAEIVPPPTTTKEDPKPSPPVEPAKTVTPAVVAPPAPAAAVPPPAPAAPPKITNDAGTKPRSSLNDKEEMTAECKVTKASAMIINQAGQPTSSIYAEITGDYNGTVYFINGAIKNGDALLVPPAFEAGKTVNLTLYGKLNSRLGKLQTFVKSLNEASSASPAMDMD